MQAYCGMASEHRLYATHSGKDGHRGKFTLPIGQQVALEEVGEQVLFEESLDVGANTAYPAFGASAGAPDISASTSRPRS